MAFNLKDAVNNGQAKLPPRVLVIGMEGVGKTTLANRFPKPLFLCAERGLVGDEFKETKNVNPTSWQNNIEILKSLYFEEHDYQTLAIDTIDWLEPMLHSHLCKRDGKKDIEDYGYGRGYAIASSEWRTFLACLEKLNVEKNMGIVFLSHCNIRPFNNPIGDNYDKYEMKVHKHIAGLTKEWCDAVLFARFEVHTYKESSRAKAKAVGGTERVVCTTNSPAWDAKNRFGMPEKLPLDYDEIMKAMESDNKEQLVELRATIKTLIDESETFVATRKEEALSALKRDKDNVVKLKTLLNKIKASA